VPREEERSLGERNVAELDSADDLLDDEDDDDASNYRRRRRCSHAFCDSKYLAHVSSQAPLAGKLMSNPVFRRWNKLKTGSEYRDASEAQVINTQHFLKQDKRHEKATTSMLREYTSVSASVSNLGNTEKAARQLLNGLCQVTVTKSKTGPFPSLYQTNFAPKGNAIARFEQATGISMTRRRDSFLTLAYCGRRRRWQKPCKGTLMLETKRQTDVAADTKRVIDDCNVFLKYIRGHAQTKPSASTSCQVSWKTKQYYWSDGTKSYEWCDNHERWFDMPFRCCHRAYDPTLKIGRHVITQDRSKLPTWLSPKTTAEYKSQQKKKDASQQKVTKLHQQLKAYNEVELDLDLKKFECVRNTNEKTHETAFVCHGSTSDGGQFMVKGFQQKFEVQATSKPGLTNKQWFPFVKIVSCPARIVQQQARTEVDEQMTNNGSAAAAGESAYAAEGGARKAAFAAGSRYTQGMQGTSGSNQAETARSCNVTKLCGYPYQTTIEKARLELSCLQV